MEDHVKTMVGGLALALRNRKSIPFVGQQLQLPWMNPNNAEQQMRAMGGVGTLFSVVNRTSNSTALVEWELWKKHPSGDKEKRTPVTRHWALEVWNKPNPFMPRQEFVESFQQHLDLTGEAWWVIATDPRAPLLPLSMWPIRPDRMNPVPHPEQFISHYEYTGPNGEKIRLELNEVIFLRMPNPLDPFRGMGPVQSVLADLDAIRYSAEWNRNFFLNGAEPGGIIEVERNLDDNEFDQMADRWEEQHKGVSNAHRVAILEGGAKWVDRKYSNRDMQFVELRGATTATVREAFGMPKFAVGDVEDVNRATAEASKAWFAEQLTVPRLERIKGALNNDFLPLFGVGTDQLEFDYVSPVPADREADNAALVARSGAAKTFLDAGFEVKDVLKVCELPEMAWTKPEPPPVTPLPPGENTNPNERVAPEDLYYALERIAKGVSRPKAEGAELSEALDELIQRAADRMQVEWETLIDRLIAAWSAIKNIQFKALVDQVREAAEAHDVEALGELTVPTGEAVELLQAYMVEMAGLGASEVVTEAAEQGVEVEPAVPGEDELSALAAVTVALLAAGLAAAVGREALRLLTPESEADRIARQVQEYLDSLTDRELRDQLGGALTNAQNRARFATMLTAPSATWYAAERNDPHACQPCKLIDNHKFESLDSAFLAYPNGGYVDCHGGVRCRGGVIPVWEEEVP